MPKGKGKVKPHKSRLQIIIDGPFRDVIKEHAVTVAGPGIQDERDLWLAELEAMQPGPPIWSRGQP